MIHKSNGIKTRFLEPKDLYKCRRVCKFISQLVSWDTLWDPFCSKYVHKITTNSKMDIYCKLLQFYGFLLNPIENNNKININEEIIWISVAGQHLKGCAMKCTWNKIKQTIEAYQLPEQKLIFSISPADWNFSTENQ